MDRLAKGDLQRHRKFGVSLNPYSTTGARHAWQRGYEGAARRTWDGSLEFDAEYQRGAAARAYMSERA